MAQSRRDQNSELQLKIQNLKSQIISETGNNGTLHSLYTQLHEAETSLNEIISTEIQGIITRSKVRWAEEGERSTKYFLGLEKSA